MAYADYTYYTDTFLGTAVKESDFPRLALRASSYLDYYTMGKAAKNAGQASRNLVLDCVHPDDKQALTDAMEEYPGIATSFATAIIKGVGISAELGN